MTLSTIKIQLEIIESEESKKISEDEKDSAGNYKKDREIHATLYINGKAITDVSEDLTDVSHVCSYSSFLLRSKDNRACNNGRGNRPLRYSYFYPITCSCGEAGCAGIWDGIHSSHKKNIVKWKIRDLKTKKIVGSKFISFDKKQYEDEIAKIWSFLESNKELYVYDYNSKTKIEKILNFYKEKSS